MCSRKKVFVKESMSKRKKMSFLFSATCSSTLLVYDLKVHSKLYWQLWYFQSSIISTLILFRMSLFESVLRWGPGEISCNDGTWQIYTLPKEDPKNLLITWNSPWAMLTFFHRKLSNFATSRNADINCISVHNF